MSRHEDTGFRKLRLHFLSGPLDGRVRVVAESLTLGRQPVSGLAVPDPAVSSEHCRIVFRDGSVFLEDLGSTNGTDVNDQAIAAATRLDAGDNIRIGDTRILVEFPEAEQSPPPSAASHVVIPSAARNLAEGAPPRTRIKQPGASPGGLASPESKIPAPNAKNHRTGQASSVPPSPSGSSDKTHDNPNNAPAAPAPPRPAPPRSFRAQRGVSPKALALAALVLALFIAALFLRGYGVAKPVARNMLDPDAMAVARARFLREGVALTVREPAGLDRHSEPVTSGVPLPEGVVADSARLVLANADGQPVPCQFVVQSRWPDGSAKWVLLDFQSTIASNAVARYTLPASGAAAPSPERPVEILREDDTRIALDNGRLRLTFDKTRPGLIHAIELDGEPRVVPDRPVGTTLVNGDDVVYHASAPDRFEVEHRGPMRTVVRIGGHYVSEDGRTIHDGKVGYDLRVAVHAGKPWLGLDFTLRNDGWYGYRNESQRRRPRPRQWLYIRSLQLDVPARLPAAPAQAVLSDRTVVLNGMRTAAYSQWFRQPYRDVRRHTNHGYALDDASPHEQAVVWRHNRHGHYRVWNGGGSMDGRQGRGPGRAVAMVDGVPALAMSAYRFVENYPGGFSVAAESDAGGVRLSYAMLPEGGCWPRTEKAFKARTYQFEGGRRKTWTARLTFGPEAGSNCQEKRLNSPLFATAATAWYRDTGAVLPLAEAFGEHGADSPFAEAANRYDRLQRAKVADEAGDMAGPLAGEVLKLRMLDSLWNRETSREEILTRADVWGRVSIPGLRERHPDIFAGWMNYGDLVWDFGYCSLHYDWPYAMLIHHLRLGDPEFLDVAEDMVRHRYDIDQYHVENTATWLGGFQRYEKGEHGHLERQTPHNTRWEMNVRPSHTWNRGLLLHWALTGDPRSLDAAEQNGRAYRRFFYDQHRLHEKETLPRREFRTPAWAIENWLALHEYTGRPEYLDWAREIFEKTLLAMERENGGRGHILPEGRQDAQQTAYMIEPVVRLHHYTGCPDAAGFLRRVLDWQRREGTLRGVRRRGAYYPLLWRTDWDYNPSPDTRIAYGATLHYNLLFADGYAYLHRLFGRRRDRDFARRLFAEFMLYYAADIVSDPDWRAPLGYHHHGSPLGFASKLHAFSGRYGLYTLQSGNDSRLPKNTGERDALREEIEL